MNILSEDLFSGLVRENESQEVCAKIHETWRRSECTFRATSENSSVTVRMGWRFVEPADFFSVSIAIKQICFQLAFFGVENETRHIPFKDLCLVVQRVFESSDASKLPVSDLCVL